MNLEGSNKYRKLIILIVLILILVGGYQIYRSTKFHVVDTNPSVNSVATLSPFIKVNFNKTILSKGISVSSTGGATDSFGVNGKTITINLNYPLSSNKVYSITINNVRDSSGAELSNLVFSFKPSNIVFNNLPQDEQKSIVNNQDHYNSQGFNISYVNTDDLINNGMSTTQLVLLEEYFSEFDPSATTVTINPGSIGIYAAPAPAKAMFKFSVTVDSMSYNAQASYTFLDNLSLTLFNSQTGAQVFNSDTYNNSSGD